VLYTCGLRCLRPPFLLASSVSSGPITCDNFVVGKHLDENTELLAEILLLSTICIRLLLVYCKIVTTPQPPYGGSHREANTGSDTLGALAATLYSGSFVLPDYVLLLAVRTELHT
jgi:hypothetical protein